MVPIHPHLMFQLGVKYGLVKKLIEMRYWRSRILLISRIKWKSNSSQWLISWLLTSANDYPFSYGAYFWGCTWQN